MSEILSGFVAVLMGLLLFVYYFSSTSATTLISAVVPECVSFFVKRYLLFSVCVTVPDSWVR